MRKFSSYGPINKDMHYFVPRKELQAKAHAYLVGEHPDNGGHYFTVWAPRQTGKTTLLRDLYWNLLNYHDYVVAYVSIQNLIGIDEPVACLNAITKYISNAAKLPLPSVKSTIDFQEVFSSEHLPKPLLLIIDEFDALPDNVLTVMVSIFRNIWNTRLTDPAPAPGKHYLLHGLALVGVRNVVGVDSKTGSPFNIQRSLHVQNLTEEEVNEMYHWYEKETGQVFEQEVIDRVYDVTRGQPGLVSWFGELLTVEYNDTPGQPLTINKWRTVYKRALHLLPNNNIINIISKANDEEYRDTVLQLFRIDQKVVFDFENPHFNYLYMHGVISYEETEDFSYVKFPCPFVQEKLFRHFSLKIGQAHRDLLVDPFIDLTSVINDEEININKLLELYQDYYTSHKEWLKEHAQRRVDLQIKEVVHHFQLFSWLESFLRKKNARVIPEFPTGNGKIDLLILYGNKCYGLELKSFSDLTELNKSIIQAAGYGKTLGLNTITLVMFVDRLIPAEVKERYARPSTCDDNILVSVFFIVTA